MQQSTLALRRRSQQPPHLNYRPERGNKYPECNVDRALAGQRSLRIHKSHGPDCHQGRTRPLPERLQHEISRGCKLYLTPNFGLEIESKALFNQERHRQRGNEHRKCQDTPRLVKMGEGEKQRDASQHRTCNGPGNEIHRAPLPFHNANIIRQPPPIFLTLCLPLGPKTQRGPHVVDRDERNRVHRAPFFFTAKIGRYFGGLFGMSNPYQRAFSSALK